VGSEELGLLPKIGDKMHSFVLGREKLVVND